MSSTRAISGVVQQTENNKAFSGDGVGGGLVVLVNIGCTLLLMVGFITIFALVPFLAIKLERHCTFADREMAILFKLTAFQILNTVLPSMIFASRSGDHLFSEFGAPNGTFVAELGLPARGMARAARSSSPLWWETWW